MADKGLTRNEIITELCRSPHEGQQKDAKGHPIKLNDEQKLKKFLAVGPRAVKEDPEFYAHLLTWNLKKGRVRDSKVALPVLGLASAEEDFVDNAKANLAMLDPRNYLRAWVWAKIIKQEGYGRIFRDLTHLYLRDLEADYHEWQRTAVQHRISIERLYGWSHFKAGARYGAILKGKYEEGSVFAMIGKLHDMSTADIAATIDRWKIPFIVARGALKDRCKEPDILMVLIERMSSGELITNLKWLESLGVRSTPALRAAMDQGMGKAAKSTENILKTSVAIDAISDEATKEKLRGVQAQQIQKAGIEGDWAILGDRSPSMKLALEAAKHVAASVASFVKGKVHLIFFDTSPMYIDVTGLSLDQIQNKTKSIGLGGGTSIGCGVQYLLDKKLSVDGIAVVSDAAENATPFFADRYKKLCEVTGKEPTVYLYRHQNSMPASGDRDLAETCKAVGIDVQTFDLRGREVDYYSLPNLVATMRTNRYSLIDEILETPLLSVKQVLKKAA